MDRWSRRDSRSADLAARNLERHSQLQSGMKARHGLALVAAVAATHADVYALNSPSESDGPVRLLACVVGRDGMLEAEVDNQSDDAMNCNISCNYEFGGKPFSHWFEVTIPKHFTGRVGHFDTNNGKAGRFQGDMGTCKKSEASGSQ
jgi:hypothetical protein